ncbi:MAG: EfeM/EfeO family lipoprotein, partial [Actinomycetota bacterium]|nr:EfeM/EfeO family lipoprotein [Actinomycetota bacterium]
MRKLVYLIAAAGLLVIPACSPDQGPATSTQGASPDTGTDANPQVQQAIAAYRTYVDGQIDETVTRTKVFTDAVRTGDLAAAQAAYAPSRVPWERIEPIAGLVEEIDGKVDA